MNKNFIALKIGNNSNNGNKGFTVFELMLVIVIIMIASASVMPTLTGSSAKSDAINVMQNIIGEISFARAQAALTGRAHSIEITKVYLGEFHIKKSVSSSCQGPFNDEVEVFDLQKQFRMFKIEQSDPQSLLSGSDSICFMPDGRVLSTATLQPFDSTLFGYGMGNAVLRLQMYENVKTGSGTTAGPAIPGFSYRIVIPYNGLAYWEAK